MVRDVLEEDFSFFFLAILCFRMQEIDTAEVRVTRAAKMLIVQLDKRDKRRVKAIFGAAKR